MKHNFALAGLTCLLIAAAPIIAAAEVREQDAAVPRRVVAVTFDDLPTAYGGDIRDMEVLTDDLLAAVKSHGVPAVGFVNEGKLYRLGEMDAAVVVEDIYQPEQDMRWVVVAPPGSAGTTLLLARASRPEQEAFVGDQAGGRVFLFLNTDDFWRDYSDMMSKGVKFVRGPKREAYGPVAVFADLHGNLCDLLELNDHPLAGRAV